MRGSSLIVLKSNNIAEEISHRDNVFIYSFIHQPSLSKESKIHYERVIRNFFSYFSEYSIQSITTAHIILYLKKMENKSATTKNFSLKVLSSLFSFLFKSGYIQRNPALVVGLEKVPDQFQSKILSTDQINRIIELETDLPKKILIKILYFTGLRISEALSLKVDSFRPSQEGGAFMTVIGKGTKVRTVFMPYEFYQEIQDYIQSQNINAGYLFFESLPSKALSRFQALRIIKAAAKRAKIHPMPSPHWFRHSSATHAIEAGAPIHVVQHTLGHASINTTGKYLHASLDTSNATFLMLKK